MQINRKIDSKLKIYTLNLIPLLFLIPYLSTLFKKEINLLSSEYNFPIYSYSDTSTTEGDGDNGNSVVSLLKRNENEVHYTYRLGEKYLHRYAGIIIKLKNGDKYFDMSRFDIMEIKLEPLNSKVLKPIIMTYKEGFTNPDSSLTCRYSEIDLDLFKHKTTYKIRLKDFLTPIWWYDFHKTTKTKIGKESYNKVAYIKFESSLLSPVYEDQSLIIKEINLKKDNLAHLIITILLILVYYTILVMYNRKVRKNTEVRIIPYEKIEAQNHEDKELSLIIKAIASEYKNSELTVKDVELETGLYSNKISTILQKHFDVSFKGYLNSIRISEAKRLLLETDWQISEIFYKIGYKNTTHFNRVFKQFNNMTPKEFRVANKAHNS